MLARSLICKLCSASALALAAAVLLFPTGAFAVRRQLYDTVNAGSAVFIYMGEFQAYVDSAFARGFRGLRVSAQWRMKCYQCAPDTLDFDTEPSLGVFDFSEYFTRLDYAINTKGMKAVVSFNLGGRLATESLDGGSQPVLPAFLGTSDVMMYRKSAGVDEIFASNLTKTPRFERASTRQAMLGFVTAVVTQFRARYGDKVTGYAFTFAHFGENEYPLANPPFFCDTSPDAAVAFRTWLQAHYGTPQAVAAAWGHSPPFTSFGQIQILDGKASPPLGQAPVAYLDFMAYREQALGQFLHEIRDAVHAAGGRAVAQFGSVWDTASATRGSFGFGPMVSGFDLVIVDDAPAYDHLYSMDYTRTNAPGVPFGNEVDAPCNLGCTTGDIGECCYPFPNPSWSQSLGLSQMNAQVSQSYARGASWVDLANWDNFYQSAFGLYGSAIANAVGLATAQVTNIAAVDTQHVSLRQLYVHHHDANYIGQLIAAHTALNGQNVPIAVKVSYDLEPPTVDVQEAASASRASLALAAPNPLRGTATIRFTLPRRQHVTLGLYDATGRLQRRLAAGVFAPGPHDIPCDAGGLPRGIYLVRLETADGVMSNKLEVLR